MLKRASTVSVRISKVCRCPPSCPALGRASMSFFLSGEAKQGVDGRDEPGHDERGHDDGEDSAAIGILEIPFLRSCSFTSGVTELHFLAFVVAEQGWTKRVARQSTPCRIPLGMPECRRKTERGREHHDPGCIRDRGLSCGAAPAA